MLQRIDKMSLSTYMRSVLQALMQIRTILVYADMG